MQNIKVTLSYPDYIHSAMLLRDAKIRAEYLNIQRSEYLMMLATVKDAIPATIDTTRLPYDLRQTDNRNILYGLCSSGRYRLQGQQRQDELHRLADEIELTCLSERKDMISAYMDTIEKMYAVKRLTDDDIQFLEIASLCDILDASGSSISPF